jgi:hypothetical protein
MQLTLKRETLSPKSTIGRLYIDGKFECYTLEDCVRDKKIKNCTAIPAGTYEVVSTFSNRFQKYLPLLLNVPNFEGVRIHSGNTDADTEGCILVGQSKGTDSIGSSRAAFSTLFAKMKAVEKKEKVYITIN